MRWRRVAEWSLAGAVLAGGQLLWLLPTWWLLTVPRAMPRGASLVGVVAAPAVLVAWSLVLGRLNRAYVGISDQPRHVLEASVVLAVLAVVVVVVLYAVFFSGSSPSTTGPFPD